MSTPRMTPPASIDDVPEDVLLSCVFHRVDSRTRWQTLPAVCKAWHRLTTTPSHVWTTLHIPSSSTTKHLPTHDCVKKLRRLAGSVQELAIGTGQPHALLACLPLLCAMRFSSLRHLQLHTPLPLTMVKPLCTGAGALQSLTLHVTMRGSSGTSSSDLDMSALARLQDLEVGLVVLCQATTTTIVRNWSCVWTNSFSFPPPCLACASCTRCGLSTRCARALPRSWVCERTFPGT